ncbi:phosphate ABC transporter permease PstA [Desulfovibrio sp. JC022]|uniref:phosphate ABC transporter permease PstA n=1 Tax=Desulfovibrio sp. JC022 TaxID=2593642 RepID=UPI0013D3EF43|nr:phosphate ABC transporter permease PstA [Desulfovibrio sp. JC022]
METGSNNYSMREKIQKVIFLLFKCAAAVNGLALLIIVGFVLYYGLPAISWEFLTENPRDSMTAGGIFPCIVGTIVLSYGALMIALPWGIATAIYLNEYATSPRLVRIIRLGINNLAGVPSVVFGLFGLSLFVTVMGMGVSIMAGVCTLGALALPLVIGASEEALRSVPQTYREASLGLGATKWQTIYKVVLPAALPGMLTGAILTLSRAAGETAAIMFTAAVFFTPEMPESLFDDVMALPYHIYVLATAGTEIEKTRHIQYGTSLVLITLVLSMNMLAIFIRAKMQRKGNK